MSKSFFVVITLSFVSFLTGCASNSSAPEMTPLEIQSMQSRSFEHPKEVVFRSVISVFQDLGYTLQDADMSTGLISAESAADSDRWFQAWTGTSKVGHTRASAFVEQIGNDTRVRLSFVEVEKTSSAWGRDDRNDTPILESGVYQNAFERIDNAIFVRSSS